MKKPRCETLTDFFKLLALTMIGCVALLIALLVVANMIGGPNSTPPRSVAAQETTTPPSPVRDLDIPLQASAGCIGDAVVVQNLGSELWLNARIEVNGDYEHTADAIAPGDKLNFMPAIFTRSDGTRLDLARIACKRIDIHATVDGKRRHYNGAYR